MQRTMMDLGIRQAFYAPDTDHWHLVVDGRRLVKCDHAERCSWLEVLCVKAWLASEKD